MAPAIWLLRIAMPPTRAVSRKIQGDSVNRQVHGAPYVHLRGGARSHPLRAERTQASTGFHETLALPLSHSDLIDNVSRNSTNFPH
jgi:hypothetical protein